MWLPRRGRDPVKEATHDTEAEYIALTEGAKRLLHRFIQELGVDQSQPTHYARTNHINVAYHLIREKAASREAAYIRTYEGKHSGCTAT
jgi:hypothetical protein